MKNSKIIQACMFLLVGSFLFVSCAKESPIASDTFDQDISIDIELAKDFESYLEDDEALERSSARFSFRTLNQALHCTGLNMALFTDLKTIYAPTDAAFAKLGLDKDNVCDISSDDLTAILLYHVTDGVVKNSDQGCQATLDGNIVQVKKVRRQRYINDVRNGFSFLQFRSATHKRAGYALKVFGIDEVLTAPTNNIVNTAVGASPEFTSLVAAVLAADPGIAAALSDEDAVFTVFAPTNDAFADLLAALGLASLEDAVAAIGVEGLSTILLYHVVDGCAFSNDLSNGQMLQTLQGESVTIDLKNLAVQDKSGTPSGLVTSSLDILTSNGIIHAIDKVLLPQAILDAL